MSEQDERTTPEQLLRAILRHGEDCNFHDCELVQLQSIADAFAEVAEASEARVQALEHDAQIYAQNALDAARRADEWKQQVKDITRNLRETQDSLEKAVTRYQAAEEAIRSVLDTFRRDEAQGYRSRDRQFAISILDAALTEPRREEEREPQ